VSLRRRGDDSSLEDERDALRRQRAEAAAELERLKQVLAERVAFVHMRERELDELLRKAGKSAGAKSFQPQPPQPRRDELAAERRALETRAAELQRREAALAGREQAVAAREAEPPPLAVSSEDLDERAAALDAREAALTEHEAEIQAQDPAEREARIDARLAELERAELQFVKTQAELAARSDRLAEREQELAARERALDGGRGNGDVPGPLSSVEIESFEVRLRRLEESTARRGTSFSAGVRSLQQRGVRPRREPDSPLH
jgi:chromosome segregation ATPase